LDDTAHVVDPRHRRRRPLLASRSNARSSAMQRATHGLDAHDGVGIGSSHPGDDFVLPPG
jgi:hypothetical protein